ncbi:hypothetical protein ACJIZ3_004948 [Penstemon smallii]|uniref:Uncharacterized protein n=1 Tax=Penstemon smallii TaxID=265156 RepID=A0ABD3S3S8_9LAMI
MEENQTLKGSRRRSIGKIEVIKRLTVEVLVEMLVEKEEVVNMDMDIVAVLCLMAEVEEI